MLYANKCIEISKKIGHQRAYVGGLHVLAKMYLYQGSIDKAFSYIQSSNTIAEEMGYQGVLNENLALQILIHAIKGDITQALKAQFNYQKLQFKQTNERLNEQLARFESDQLSQQIELLQQNK
ncbi:MAG: hypothetical protein JJV99_10120 [Colwellia sp.]|nr:hypothetical protein [Colwellia sp.]